MNSDFPRNEQKGKSWPCCLNFSEKQPGPGHPMHSRAEDAFSISDFFRQEFAKLANSCQTVPYGLAIFDLDLRFVHVNDTLAAFNKNRIEHFTGQTFESIDPAAAQAVTPLLRHVLKEGTPLLDIEVEANRTTGTESPQADHWRIKAYPCKTNTDEVLGVGVVFQNITEAKKKEAAQEERLLFEALLSDLSAAFINVPISEVDGKIEQGLKKIVDFLGFERSSIWQFVPEDNHLHLTHSYSLSGVKPPPPVLDEAVPVWTSMVRQGKMFRVSDVDELPDNLWREKKYCREHGGIKSFLFIPLNVGGTIWGLMSFASYRVKRSWPDDLIQRLKLLWDIFGNALERKRADQEIQKAISEIEALKNRLVAENIFLRDQIDIEQKYDEIVGQSGEIRKVLLQLGQVATTDSTVLILGETGTGKELLARAIHNQSRRKDRPMIKLNCAALPATLIESELFGHEKGAFTGAVSTQIGRFEAANGSTIFLDEIGELPLELQAKLLRVLQEGQFERLGSARPIDVDTRVVAASNRDLLRAVKEGTFREDLYYRLNVFPLSIPPLRERREDIPLLVWAMIREFGPIFGKTIERIPKKNMEALKEYAWPGNIRELRNLIERAMILSNSSTLVINLPDKSLPATAPDCTLAAMERKYILSVLEKTGWRVRGSKGAAKILDLKPTTLDSKMKKLDIKRVNK
jgi:transcriptional regulator with GAF, ATPase, and Fis domain